MTTPIIISTTRSLGLVFFIKPPIRHQQYCFSIRYAINSATIHVVIKGAVNADSKDVRFRSERETDLNS